MKGLSLLVFVLQFCIIRGSAPVFIWSNDKSTDFPRAIVGHHTSRNEFAEKYLRKFSDHVVVFVQDELSVADILVHGGVYGSNVKKAEYEQLKSAMMEFTATYLPNVENPLDSLLKIANGDKALKMVSVNPNDIISSLQQADFSKKSLFFVDLSLSKKNKAEYDAIIGEVVSYLKDKCLFTAFFTGRQVEMKFGEVPEKVEKIRHLMSSEKQNITPIISGSFMMKFQTLSINGSNQTLSGSDVTVTVNECDAFNRSSLSYLTNCTVSLRLDTPLYEDLVLSFLFGVTSTKFWYVKEARLKYNNDSGSMEANMTRSFVSPTPIWQSYSCSRLPPIKTIDKWLINDVPSLTFEAFQMEIFRDTNKTGFGYYNDCTGFFTIGIWMFLICAAILLSILGFGIVMLLGINTMDRYDDPKGKTITVATGD